MLAALAIVLVLVLALASGAALLLAAKRAPEGYEDEEGFQLGPTPPGLGRDEVAAVKAAGAGAGQNRAHEVRIKGSAARKSGSPVKVG
jgi:hypothetical protein